MTGKRKNKKITRKTSSNKRNTHRSRKRRGGSAFASGGYGCIFTPALKCVSGNNQTYDSKKVSKLMLTEYANREYYEVNRIKNVLKNVPSYEKYFLLDNINICKPAELTNEDLENFTSKCTSLQSRNNITIDNVNQSVDKLRIINMPNGGTTINEMVGISQMDGLLKIHRSLIQLLENGIIPMNKLNVYHCDVKDTNILINSSYESLLIDWGFAFIKKTTSIPKMLKKRPFQFNLPFSVILFSDEFKNMRVNFSDKLQAEDIVKSYKEKKGHYEYINKMICAIKNEPDIVKGESQYTFPLVVDYIYDSIRRFSSNGVFDALNYYNNEFIHNVDIWGFIVTYLPLVKKNDAFRVLFENHLFKSGLINLNSLREDLERLSRGV